MSKKEEREMKLKEICQRISKLSYKDLQDEFSTEFKDRINTEIEQSIDLTIESRLEKYNNPRTIDDLGKNTLKYIIDILKSRTLKFQNSDTEKIQYFTSKINTLLQGTNYSGVGIDNRINLIKDGPNNDVKGHSINLVELFNDFKEYDKFSDFIQKSNIDKAFIENKTFLSHIRYLYSICKGCEDINKYPLYYKQWQLFGLWFFGIARHDYDSFCNHYNYLNNLGEPKLLNFACYYYLIGLKLKTDEEYKLLINESEKEKKIIEELIWADKFPSEPSVEENDPEVQIINKELQFKEWLKIYMPKSAEKYFSYFNTANKISQVSELGNLFIWSKKDWAELESMLREVPDFIDKNSSGHNSLTASIAQYKKFMSMESSTIKIPPQIPFSDFKWRWAVTTPSESINSEDILFGVLKILVKHNGKRHATQEFKDDLLKLQNETKTSIDLAKLDRDLNKNIIENSGQYWKALGLLNSTNDGTISVSEVGLGIVNGSTSKEDYIKYLYDNFNLPNQNIESESVIQTYKNSNLCIYPIKIIFQVLYSITKTIQSPSEWYVTPDELKDIIVPLSVYPELEYDSYAELILSYRNDKSLFTAWPNVTPGDNDFRMLKEYLIFLSNFGYIDLVELKDRSKRYYINELTLNIINGNLSQTNYKPTIPISVSQKKFDLKTFEKDTKVAGLIFSLQLIHRFVSSLLTKPFVICSGLSGSGKTKLAQAFAQWITIDESQYVIVPVGADWTNREPLLGYPNALDKEEYVSPENGVLALMIRAKQNIENTEEPTKPHFLILDEMNLSHVERYFADFLSTMESGDKIPLHKIENDSLMVPPSIKLPKNLFIIGTVNIDETTYMFSPKVLDRANTIEFRLTDIDLKEFIGSDINLNMDYLTTKGANMSESFMALALKETDKNLKESEKDLILFFTELKKSGAEFGYRTVSEIGRLIYMLKELGEDGDNLLDIAIMQKLLPKLHGSRNKLTKVLPVLGGFCLTDKSKIKEEYLDKFVSNNLTEEELKTDPNIKYKISFEKICRMYKNAVENGFASYAEA
jgi:hypothetical protein